ncbi:metallophosphoesterase [Corynebacterium propinquum]|uniref:Metallophosphoesterase n=1 Tax=Corynebacterium propinquum TaxID=43769 RepID=A0ABT7G020_9CORY|nr:metallophosphoesterase [Corynebacterium propinquum]MCG7230688.1 metallophosphoesterase [Corynebacterium propinquum]MCT1818791.1 metallophosphoesterase [Corynebacterium propinquum]MDK4281006.1 metallophosphoesterase [Corynebacterium propinquum]MDK4299876.1 metallophosphoesterase [Corynebacterium propinquum]MDK4312602.1 metallophosphoesterase [Corynebacterium propinquum]
MTHPDASSDPVAFPPTLWAVADLHAAVRANRKRLAEITPRHPDDWLIVAGDVAERTDLIASVLSELRSRFSQVIWVPGNHELFCRSTDSHVGRAKYDSLVQLCREIDVLTPEDSFPVFGDTTIVPLFTLYDYSFRPAGMGVEEALDAAAQKNVVLADEIAIAPFTDIRAWCWDRLAYSITRLSRVNGPTVLINHWPLVQEPTLRLGLPEIALWCGTRHTRHWPRRYRAKAVVYGHLHMPDESEFDGVVHHEVSLGYPREWTRYDEDRVWPCPILELADDGTGTMTARTARRQRGRGMP